MTAPNESPIAKGILSYLLGHTTAEDSIEGIVEWWLLEETIKHRTNEIQEVLNELVRENLICARKTKDSRIRYRINEQKIEEIRAVLESEGKMSQTIHPRKL